MTNTVQDTRNIEHQIKFWDRMSKNYDRTSPDVDANDKRRLSKIRDLVDETDVVLDFACATGEIGLDLAPYVASVHGIDISGVMIARAKSKALARNIANIDFTLGNIFDTNLPPHSFSAILAFNIFHLLDDVPAVLARMHELLVPGGLLISNTPCLGEGSWIIRSTIGLAMSAKLAPPVHNLKVNQLESLISTQDFKILESEHWHKTTGAQWILARTPWA